MWLGISVSRQKREVEFDPQPGSIIGQDDAGAVQIGHRGNQAKAEPVAGTVPAAFETVEPSEHLLAFLSWYSRPAIADYENGAVGFSANRYRDFATVATVLDCIVDEVGDGVE